MPDLLGVAWRRLLISNLISHHLLTAWLHSHSLLIDRARAGRGRLLDSGAPARSTGEDVSLEHVLPVVALTAFTAVKRPIMEKTVIKT